NRHPSKFSSVLGAVALDVFRPLPSGARVDIEQVGQPTDRVADRGGLAYKIQNSDGQSIVSGKNRAN
ncbi:MAG: hypothetical protein O7A03_10285, partial [Alphaproteobacteria bacterium]|nr:hypothetical protein [Alphaproteobacteria bacterium]